MSVELLLSPEGLRASLESSRAAIEAAAAAAAVIAARSTLDPEVMRRALRSLRIGLRMHH